MTGNAGVRVEELNQLADDAHAFEISRIHLHNVNPDLVSDLEQFLIKDGALRLLDLTTGVFQSIKVHQ